jgi:hypothetical protein
VDAVLWLPRAAPHMSLNSTPVHITSAGTLRLSDTTRESPRIDPHLECRPAASATMTAGLSKPSMSPLGRSLVMAVLSGESPRLAASVLLSSPAMEGLGLEYG